MLINIKSSQLFLFTIFLFVYIYLPSFSFAPKLTTILLPLLLNVFAILTKQKQIISALTKIKCLSLLMIQLFLLILWAFFLDVSFNSINNSYVSTNLYSINLLKIFLVIVNSISIYYLFFKDNFLSKTEHLIRAFLWIVVFQFIISLIMFINSDIKNYINFNLLITSQKFLSTDIYDYRGGIGLSSEYLFTFPLFNAWIASMVLFLYFSYRKNGLLYLLFVPMTILPAILNARISLMFIVSSIISLIFVEPSELIKYKFWYKKIIPFFVLFLFPMFFLVSYFLSFVPETTRLWILLAFNDIFKTLSFNLIDLTSYFGLDNAKFFFRASSEALLSTHLFFPSDVFSLFLGQGEYIYANTASEISSDIGYVRMIFFGGITFTFALIYSVLNFLLKIYKLAKKKFIKEILLSGVILILIANIKGLIFDNNALLRGIILFAVFVLLDQNQRNFQS